jgi:uncharacterized protein (TIGR03086 family)
MNEPEVFALADHALAGVVAQITDDQWSMPMPADFQTRVTDHVPSLREIVNYHAYDDAWVPDMLAGRTMDEVGQAAFQGDLLGDDPKRNFDLVVAKAVAATRSLDDLERTVHCSFGDFTARQYLWQANFFRGLRAHDIARVLGVEPALPDALVEGLWEELTPIADEWRTIGVIGPAVDVPADAPLLARLLGLTGRDPHLDS